MTGLMTIFLVIGAIGLLFLLISLVVGDVFEALGFDFDLDASHDFGVFDSRVIAVFLTAFGGFGAIGASLGYGAVGGSLFGLLGGFVFGAIVFYFGKFLYSQQSTSSVSEEDLIGAQRRSSSESEPTGLDKFPAASAKNASKSSPAQRRAKK